MYSYKTRGQHSGIIFSQSVFDSTIYIKNQTLLGAPFTCLKLTACVLLPVETQEVFREWSSVIDHIF